jgi:hypothetical protein
MVKPFTLPKDGEQMDAAYMKAEFERNGWTKEEVIEYWENEKVNPDTISVLIKEIFGDEKLG